MNEDEIKHEIGIVKLQIFINIIMTVIILLSMYVAFDAAIADYSSPGIKGILSKVIMFLMFLLMGLVNYIAQQSYYLFKNLKALNNELNMF